MKTVHNHHAETKSVAIHGSQTVITIPGHGSRELEDSQADDAVAQAKSDGVEFHLHPPKTATRGTRVPQTAPASGARVPRAGVAGTRATAKPATATRGTRVPHSRRTH